MSPMTKVVRTMKNKRTDIRQVRSILTSFAVREEGDELRIEGYFAVFGSNYEVWPGATESIDLHAFDDCLTDDVRCLIDHDTRLVLGRTKSGTLTLRVDNHGLFGIVVINRSDTDAMNLYARVQRGDVDQCSFGFDILDEETEYREDGSVHWTIKKVKLYEVSCVTFPAYTETSLEARQMDYDQIKKRELDAFKARVKGRLHHA